MQANTTTSFSGSFNVNTGGTNVVAFAVLTADTFVDFSTPTINGTPMTRCGASAENTNSSYIFASVWYLANPPTGSVTLAVTNTGATAGLYANLVVFQGVLTSQPVRPGTYITSAATDKTTAGGTYSITISSNSNDLTLTCCDINGSSAPTTNQTLDGNSGAQVTTGASDHATTAATSVTHIWTDDASSDIALVGFSIQAAPVVASSGWNWTLNSPTVPFNLVFH